MGICDHRKPCSVCVDNTLELLSSAASQSQTGPPADGVAAYFPPCRKPPIGPGSGGNWHRRKNSDNDKTSWLGDLVGVPRPRRVRLDTNDLDRSVLTNPNDWVEVDLVSGEVHLISTDIDRSAPLFALYLASETSRAANYTSIFPSRPRLDRDPQLRCTEVRCVCQPFYPEDKRSRLGYCDGYPFDYYPLSAIGQITFGANSPNSATGTLIGRRTVLCAAHSTGVTKGAFLFGLPIVPSPAIRFRARADNTQNLTVQPYGAARALRLWVPLGYVWPSAAFMSSKEVNPFDIALLQLEVPKSDPIPMGDKAGRMLAAYIVDKPSFESYKFYMLGYPLCSSLQHRPLCCPSLPALADNNAALWGDAFPGKFLSYRDDMLSFDPEVNVSNFGTFGMSGSALFTYDSAWSPGNPVALGVYSSMEVSGRWCTRITPEYAIQMSVFMAMYDSYPLVGEKQLP